jgi:hypothetical protein
MSQSEVNDPTSYPTLNVTGVDVNSNLSVTPIVTSIEIVDPDAYPKLNITVSDYPSLTILESPNIVIGGGGGGGGIGPKGEKGDAGPQGSAGPAGATGYGYTGAFISGSTLYMVPVLNGIPQSPVAIGTVSGGGSESLWVNSAPTNVTVGGLTSGSVLTGYNAIKILEGILYQYQPVSFTSFSTNLGSNLLELNQTTGSGNFNSTWSTSGPTGNWTSNSLSIVRTVNGGSDTTIASGFSYNASPRSITHPTYQYTSPTTLAFTINGSQAQGSSVSYTESYYWLYKVYWGSSASTSITNFSGFSSEFNSSTPSTARSFVGNGTQQYYYFVIPSTFTSYVKFKDTSTQNTVPFLAEQTINVTNPYGQSITYKYYRSSNSSAGSITILPSIS